MCKVARVTSPTCKCVWLQILRPCAPNMGFSTCPDFDDRDRRVRRAPREREWDACPVHVLYGQYDRNLARMVVSETRGWKFGAGPEREDVGVECKCLVM